MPFNQFIQLWRLRSGRKLALEQYGDPSCRVSWRRRKRPSARVPALGMHNASDPTPDTSEARSNSPSPGELAGLFYILLDDDDLEAALHDFMVPAEPDN
jgi:hypothetical protein